MASRLRASRLPGRRRDFASAPFSFSRQRERGGVLMVNCGRSGAVLRRGRVSVLVALLVLGGGGLLRKEVSNARGKTLSASPVTSSSLLARLPLFFEPNLGQTEQPVKFLARGRGYGLYLTHKEAVL